MAKHEGFLLNVDFNDIIDIQDNSRHSVINVAPVTDEVLGPAFQITKTRAVGGPHEVPDVRPQTLACLVSWYGYLSTVPIEVRADLVKGWQMEIGRDANLLLRCTVSAAQAASLLDVKPAMLHKLAQQNRVRWVKFERGQNPIGDHAAWRVVDARDSVLIHTADLLMYAAERLKRLSVSGFRCPHCKGEYREGGYCPECKNRGLERC